MPERCVRLFPNGMQPHVQPLLLGLRRCSSRPHEGCVLSVLRPDSVPVVPNDSVNLRTVLMTIGTVAAGQAVIIGIVLLVSGSAKAADQSPLATARQTALAGVFGGTRLLLAWRTITIAELAVGALAVTRLWTPWSSVPLAALMLATTAYTIWARRAAPESTCGCMGSTSRYGVSNRTIVRNAAFAILALVSVFSSAQWPAISRHPLVVLAIFAEVVVCGLQFPEIRAVFGAERALTVETCASAPIPAIETLRSLRRTDIWNVARVYLKSAEPGQEWRQGCWRYFTFPAEYSGERAVAVFSVHLGGQAQRNSCAFVHEVDDRVLGVLNARTIIS